MDALKKQYQDSKKFMARVELNRRFGTNPYKWTLWVFDQIKFPENAKVLELGCGNALLWKSNLDRIPEDATITLSDFSEGMLKDARKILGDAAERFEYKIIDAQEILFPDGSFDIVIANYMLYHVPNRKKAISEISRVLKNDGTFYTAAFGLNYMKELTDLVFNYNYEISYSLKPLALAFGLENGEEQLHNSFKDVKIRRYEDKLIVTEAEPLVNFVLSSTNVIKEDMIKDFTEYVRAILDNYGKIEIKKNSGIFVATK